MRRLACLTLLVTLTVAACSDGASAGCTELREPLDPLSVQHVIGNREISYLTDPPTSGPHRSGPPAAGVLDSTLTPAAQVRVLETGGIVVQYRNETGAGDLASLVADGAVAVVAPGVDLPAEVVATAWTWKLSCGNADLEAIRAFAQKRGSGAPGED